MIWIENLVSNWFGFIRIDVSELIGLNWIDFSPLFTKRDTKRFSDWFEMIRIVSDTDIGMNRNSSDWLEMNFNPILLPEIWEGIRFVLNLTFTFSTIVHVSWFLEPKKGFFIPVYYRRRTNALFSFKNVQWEGQLFIQSVIIWLIQI